MPTGTGTGAISVVGSSEPAYVYPTNPTQANVVNLLLSPPARSYDNIIDVGTNALVIENIQNNPTSYTVYDFYGNAVATGSIATPTAPVLHSSVGAVAASSTSTCWLTPSTTPSVGDTLILVFQSGTSPSAGSPEISGGGVSNWILLPESTAESSNYGLSMAIGTITSVPGSVPTGGSTVWSVGVSISNPTGGNTSGTISHWSGLTGYGVVDQHGSTNVISSASFAPAPNLRPNSGGQVVLMATGAWGTLGSTPHQNMTALNVASGVHTYACGYIIQTTPTTVATNVGFNLPGSANNGWHTIGVTLAPAVGGTTVSIPVPSSMSGTWKPGWYFVSFDSSAITPTTYGTMVDSVQVTMIRSSSNLPNVSDLPPYGNTGAADQTDGNNNDLYLHGFTAMGPERYAIQQGWSPTTTSSGSGTTLSGVLSNVKQDYGTLSGVPSSWYLDPAWQDPNRPRTALVVFPQDVLSNSTSDTPAAFYAGVKSVAQTLAPYPITFEGFNEPDAQGLSWSAAADQYKVLKKAVIDGYTAAGVTPRANVIGPTSVGVAPNGSNISPQIASLTNAGSYFPELAATAGWSGYTAATSLDGFSSHFYNGYNGDFLATENWFSAIRTLIGGTIPFWCTEAGSIRTDFFVYGSGLTSTWGTYADVSRWVSWLATLYLSGERHGMPKEQIAFFYDNDHGFTYNSFLKQNGQLRPHFVFFRVYGDELFGKQYNTSHGNLDFGSIGNNLYQGTVFTSSSYGNMVALIGQGFVGDTVTLAVPDTGTITYSDWQGNVTSVNVIGGHVTIPVSTFPTYVRLAGTGGPTSNPNVSVVDTGSGVKSRTSMVGSATIDFNGTAPSNSYGATTNNLANVISGTVPTGGYIAQGSQIHSNPNVYIGSDCDFSTTTLPAALTLTWGSAQSLGGVILRQRPPWLEVMASAMVTGKLEYWNGTSWVGVPTVAGNHWDTAGNYNNTTAVSRRGSFADPHTPSWMTFYDYNWVHNVAFSSNVSTTKLRWTISSATTGNVMSDQTVDFPEASTSPTVNVSQIIPLSGTAQLTAAASGVISVGGTVSGVNSNSIGTGHGYISVNGTAVVSGTATWGVVEEYSPWSALEAYTWLQVENLLPLGFTATGTGSISVAGAAIGYNSNSSATGQASLQIYGSTVAVILGNTTWAIVETYSPWSTLEVYTWGQVETLAARVVPATATGGLSVSGTTVGSNTNTGATGQAAIRVMATATAANTNTAATGQGYIRVGGTATGVRGGVNLPSSGTASIQVVGTATAVLTNIHMSSRVVVSHNLAWNAAARRNPIATYDPVTSG